MIYKEANNIGDKGCEYLSKGNWPDLTVISLGQNMITLAVNNIGGEGIKKLTKC